MLRRLREHILLRPQDFTPSRDDFEVVGVFNPGAVKVGDEIILLVRVAERPVAERPGWIALPRWGREGELIVERMRAGDLDTIDPRVVRVRAHGSVRLTSVSHLRVARSRDGLRIDTIDEARFLPETELEAFGVEDPRVTRIGDRYYFSFVAVSPHGAATALASTADFRAFERHGVIFCPENKDVVLFPGPSGGRFHALHRPTAATRFAQPEIWIAESEDLIHWGRNRPVHTGSEEWSAERIGAGPPPIRTGDGWLVIYHGKSRAAAPGAVGAYSAGVLLLAADDPGRVLRAGRAPILAPSTAYERHGFVPDVVFPTGIVEKDETLLIYYGAADTVTAVVEVARNEMMAALQGADAAGKRTRVRAI